MSFINLPGHNISLWDVLVFYWRGITRGILTYRASAISFNFFIAIIPTLLFLVTLIPFITTPNFQDNLFDFLDDMIPASIFDLIEGTIIEVLSRPRNDILSITFLTALYFSTNGIDAIMESFHHGYYKIKKRTWLKQRLIALFLLIILTFLGLISVTFLMFGKSIINTIGNIEGFTEGLTLFILNMLQWIITVGNILLSMSLLFYFGQKRDKGIKRFRFFSPGAILSTFLFLLGGFLLKMYFENITRYNILYGSFGSLIVFMIWIYYNSLIILIGFELNSAIRRLNLLLERKQNEKSEIKERT